MDEKQNTRDSLWLLCNLSQTYIGLALLVCMRFIRAAYVCKWNVNSLAVEFSIFRQCFCCCVCAFGFFCLRLAHEYDFVHRFAKLISRHTGKQTQIFNVVPSIRAWRRRLMCDDDNCDRHTINILLPRWYLVFRLIFRYSVSIFSAVFGSTHSKTSQFVDAMRECGSEGADSANVLIRRENYEQRYMD